MAPLATNEDTEDPFFSAFSSGQQSVWAPQQELDQYFSLPVEPYRDGPDPVQWWNSRRSQFPCLSRMARDILSIPGMSCHHFLA
jgi:hypothetical protein